MTGQQLCDAARDGDAAKVSTLLSTQGARSFINYQGAHGVTALHLAAENGHAVVMEKILAAHCNVDLQDDGGERRSTSRPGKGLRSLNAAPCCAL